MIEQGKGPKLLASKREFLARVIEGQRVQIRRGLAFHEGTREIVIHVDLNFRRRRVRGVFDAQVRGIRAERPRVAGGIGRRRVVVARIARVRAPGRERDDGQRRSNHREDQDEGDDDPGGTCLSSTP